MEFIHVESVEYLGGYRLRVGFSDGALKDVDLADELWGEVFEPLKDLALFEQARVGAESKTVEWPNGADFAPEFLYGVGGTVE